MGGLVVVIFRVVMGILAVVVVGGLVVFRGAFVEVSVVSNEAMTVSLTKTGAEGKAG